MKQSHYVMVIYDSVTNSVFEGQVLEPLKKKQAQGLVTLITFEHSSAIPHIDAVRISFPELNIIVLKKFPFMGMWSLQPAVYQLKRLLHRLQPSRVSARGPLAGYICVRALSMLKLACPLIIQARGLLAAEYEFTHQRETFFIKKWLYRVREYLFFSLECTVYQPPCKYVQTQVEVVSSALGKYLTTTFNTPASAIILAYHDIPPLINPTQKLGWRTDMRTSLNIPQDAYVYCYNGSAKPWQCPDEIISFFKKQYEHNHACFLLVLTQDAEEFSRRAQQAQLEPTSYLIKRVEHCQIYEHLAVADAGLLFREPHIVNWTSRPTKALEYQALGMPIIHNNTVAMLTEEH